MTLSDFGQIEDVEDGDDGVEEERNFSPDLKIFVGNLPFSADSAALAELFERAGNVEMVEVIYKTTHFTFLLVFCGVSSLYLI